MINNRMGGSLFPTNMARPARLLASLVVTGFFSGLHAGWVIHQVHESGATETIVIASNQMRITGGGTVMLMNLEKETLAILVPARKVFFQGRPSDLHPARDHSMVKNLEKDLNHLPPDQRSIAEAYIRERQAEFQDRGQDHLPVTPPKVIVRDTGRQEQISGIATRIFEVFADEQLVETVWISGISVLKDLNYHRLQKFSAAMAGLEIGMSYETSETYIRLLQKGFPMKILQVAGESMTVTRIENQTVSASQFRIPEGFVRTDLSAVLMFQNP
ncbi:DUF4412 domain-containing protein [bacterium]|nr:DUF4412 domain-containing protein [bacterium]